ncbi:NAD(P)H-dependent oxidoreductase [Paenibacillus sp. CF384]|uniref:NAD(P)H-dependent oxidoreductase n=1 Tax=Paenibacillus sp. CF384 TaxID=1884382 RepID=UPI0008955519|nr:SAF domain-containing protein [Paenibacillus sp. CF384]SDX46469.1 Predicted homoserine dehydrogenase, contains C-terminal SAF domain [Paenibacillus sp. CF384]
MDNLLLRLLTCREKSIRVGIAGAGRFSTGLVIQAARMKGMKIAVLYDANPYYATEAYLAAGFSRDEIKTADSEAAIQAGIEAGKPVIAINPYDMLSCDLDVIVDSTGLPVFGAQFAYEALRHKKHVVMVNIEADVGVGAALRSIAEQEGVVYTLADGDQPSLAKGLYDWARTLGFDVPVLGKWMTVHSQEEVDRRLNDRDAMRDTDIAYWDGSKYQIEMACMANMTGYVPDIPGMHKPQVPLSQIPEVFRLREEGGILHRHGVVEVVDFREIGDVSHDHLNGGVFIVIASTDPFVQRQLRDKGIPMSTDGSQGVIYRAHHFVGMETPISIAKAVLLGEATGSPQLKATSDVVAVAKRTIKAGETLDGMGGETVRAHLVAAVGSSSEDGLPYALAQNVIARVNIPKGTIITYGMLRERGSDFIWQLREMQDGLRAF